MNLMQKETKSIRSLLFPILGETTVTTYFSYYGIFKDGFMFGLYKNGAFYLKVSDEHIDELRSYQGVLPLEDKNIKNAHKFYMLPQSMLDDLSLYHNLITHSIEFIKSNRYVSCYNKRDKIRSLPNMNITLERMLNKIDINSVEQLTKKGEIEIFVDLIKNGFDASHMTLFKLYGAINHQLIYTLSSQVQNDLLREADNALYEAGLRKRFNVK